MFLEKIRQQVSSQEPFSRLNEDDASNLFHESRLVSFDVGSRLLRPDELSGYVYIIVRGSIRLLANDPAKNIPITLKKCGVGQIIGWSNLLSGAPLEWVTASESTVALAISAKSFVKAITSNINFANHFSSLPGLQEAFRVASEVVVAQPYLNENWSNNIIYAAKNAFVHSFLPENNFPAFTDYNVNLQWYLSTSGVPGHPVGSLINPGDILPSILGYSLPFRAIGLPSDWDVINHLNAPDSNIIPSAELDSPTLSLEELGIVEDDAIKNTERFPIIRGLGQLQAAMAVCEMICLKENVPFRRDIVKKVLLEYERREKDISIQAIGGLLELLGLNIVVAEVNIDHFSSIEAPVFFMMDGIPIVYFAKIQGKFFLGHPVKGLLTLNHKELASSIDTTLSFAIPRRVNSTPTSRFGWAWFTPLVKKYRGALVLVFLASLLAQLFGLAVPLLIQQIIDKVLTQGNLSSLNILGTAMVTFALFQGLLTVLRTYVFVDTTDRMDLTLGSSVIDRLLSLPLSFFEKRPVGELSQRIGELNTIRSFLTGTALVSVLNIFFAVIYLAVMLVYSPLLTAVSLCTLPIYILLVVVVAPIYKSLIRNRAVAQARTQSHLIEVLGGIQTVKAQHFELTARWKWQDRYRVFVSEGFKSAALGASAGEIGNFLNTISGLLVLWVGMWLVLKGELTLGMIIAFRIISGKVTGPLLQLSSLYQGFQSVQLSMERLGDILDQTPELSPQEAISQIPMPPIKGDIRFEDVSFRFGRSGPYQVNNVSLSIPSGSFVGIVGQSGSGKSTLTKLIPRLYNSSHGRIFIDDYDINKVNLSSLRRQIGIVPQDSLLFEGTISENIALNDPQASTDSIIDSAHIACAHEFIMSLEQGYATRVAEKGSNLSGGQRQRIAIARTILASPKLLIMDEATSALDFDTERRLCLNLQKWANNRTVLYITHRLSTVKSSDLIYVMNNGSLVEEGTHNDLIQLAGRYYTLYNQQGFTD